MERSHPAAAGTATITYGAVSGGSCVAGNTATAAAPRARDLDDDREVDRRRLVECDRVEPSINVYSADGPAR